MTRMCVDVSVCREGPRRRCGRRPPSMGSPQAVIFDTDGLLLDTDRIPVAQVEAVSVCAGQGQNLIGALAEHGGGHPPE